MSARTRFLRPSEHRSQRLGPLSSSFVVSWLPDSLAFFGAACRVSSRRQNLQFPLCTTPGSFPLFSFVCVVRCLARVGCGLRSASVETLGTLRAYCLVESIIPKKMTTKFIGSRGIL